MTPPRGGSISKIKVSVTSSASGVPITCSKNITYQRLPEPYLLVQTYCLDLMVFRTILSSGHPSHLVSVWLKPVTVPGGEEGRKEGKVCGGDYYVLQRNAIECTYPVIIDR